MKTKWIHSWDFNELRKTDESIQYRPDRVIVHDGEYVMVDDTMPRGVGFLPESDERVKVCIQKHEQRQARERALAEDRLRYDLSQRKIS